MLERSGRCDPTTGADEQEGGGDSAGQTVFFFCLFVCFSSGYWQMSEEDADGRLSKELCLCRGLFFSV